MNDKDKKKLSEGISIQTDTLEDQIALMAILKNAGLDPQQMNIQQKAPMNAPAPDMTPDTPIMDKPEEPEAEAYDNEPDEKYLDKDDYELKRNKVPNKDMGPSAASRGDNPLPEGEEVEEAKHAKPDYIDLDGDGDKEESMKKAAKDKEAKEKSKKEDAKTDTETLIAELNKQYELMLVGGAQESLNLTASARIVADESLYDGANFVIAEVVSKPEAGLVAEDGAWEGDTTSYRVAYLVKEGNIVGQVGSGDVPYLSQDGNGTRPVNHQLNVLDLNAPNFFEDYPTAVDSIKAMYEDLGEQMFGEVTTEFGGCEMYRNE